LWHFIDGSLALASLNRTCRDRCLDVSIRKKFRNKWKKPTYTKGQLEIQKIRRTVYDVRVSSRVNLSPPHKVCWALWQKRLTEAKIWSADLVHLKGFGFLLCWSMKVGMSASSCLTEV
jgi:hypothetical protein